MSSDVMNDILELTVASELSKLREQRPELKRLTQSSYDAALNPAEPRNFSPMERAALAGRMARLWKSSELAAHYDDLLQSQGGDAFYVSVSNPELQIEGATHRQQAIIRHVDLITLKPKQATRSDIDKLDAAGLDDRDIVTLANLIAFVNYQILVASGLRMLRDN